jgi:hypothetical protein
MKKRLELARTTLKVLKVRTDLRAGAGTSTTCTRLDSGLGADDALALASPALPKPLY